MNFRKKLLTAALLFLLAVVAGSGLAGCGEDEKNSVANENRDVVFLICDDEGKTFEFPVGQETMRISRDYDGKEHEYAVKYKYENDDAVFMPKPQGDGSVVVSWIYTAPDGTQETETCKVKETGEYCLSVNTPPESSSWNFRQIKLYITVQKITVLKPSEEDIIFEVPALTAGESAIFRYTAEREETLYLICERDLYQLDAYCGGFSCSVRLYDYLTLPVEKGEVYDIVFKNNTEFPRSPSVGSLRRMKELVLNEDCASFELNEEECFLFRAPIACCYEIAGLPAGVTGRILGGTQLDSGVFYLEEKEYVVNLYGRASDMKCHVRFFSEEIMVDGGSTFFGRTKSLFVKFAPKLSADYKIECRNASVTHLFKDGELTDYFFDESRRLIAGETYFFRLSRKSETPDTFSVKIALETIAEITIDEARGFGEAEISGSGEQFVLVNVTRTDVYTITGIPDYAVFDRFLQEYFPSSALSEGKVYLKVALLTGRTYRLQMQAGFPMQVGDTIGIVRSRMFRYDDLEEGAAYTVTIRKSALAKFTTSVVLWDSSGNSYAPDEKESGAAGDVYTFIARDRVMYVDLITTNMNGQAGIFTLTKKVDDGTD